MSASGGGKAIIAAFLANMGIAIAKFVAWLISGSASMLAEAIHSVADSGNQLLLLLGGRRARREADTAAPVRLRPRALRLRIRRLDHPVLRRRPLLDLRGHRQDQASARDHELLDPDRRSGHRHRAGVVLAAHRGQREQPRPHEGTVVGRLRPPREGSRTAGRAARRHRRPHGSRVRPVRRRA